MAASALIGVGAGLAYPSLRTLLAEVTPEEHRPMAFSAEHALLNMGFSIGALVAAAIVVAGALSQFRLIYILDAVTFLAAAVLLGLLITKRPRSAGGADQIDESDRQRGYRDVLADATFRRLCLVELLLIVFGYVQFTAALPLGSHVQGDSPPGPSRSSSPSTRLPSCSQRCRLAAGPFRFGAMSLSSPAEPPLPSAGSCSRSRRWWHTASRSFVAAGAAAVMGLAETLLAPALGPMVNALAPAALRGRYNAVDASTLSVGTILGPSLTAILIGTSTRDLFTLLAGGCVAAALVTATSTSLRKIPVTTLA